MFEDFDLQGLRSLPRFAYYFRYPLHHSDFRELREGGQLLGRIAAKPLYGRLTDEGRVDRSAGFNGKVAIIFIPTRARKPESAKLLMARMSPRRVQRIDGKRNWPAIYKAAERAVRRSLASP